MSINWGAFLLKLPVVITGIVSIIGKVKGASHADKVDASVSAVLESVSLTEFAVGKDLLNDPEIAALLKALVDAEHAALAARDALKAGIINKGAQ